MIKEKGILSPIQRIYQDMLLKTDDSKQINNAFQIKQIFFAQITTWPTIYNYIYEFTSAL